jgi:hypothetical protein
VLALAAALDLMAHAAPAGFLERVLAAAGALWWKAGPSARRT